MTKDSMHQIPSSLVSSLSPYLNSNADLTMNCSKPAHMGSKMNSELKAIDNEIQKVNI